MSTLREYFLLTDATATAKRIPEGDRKTLERQLRTARQRAEAADALWSNGHSAEGLRLAADAFRSTLDAGSRFAEALGLGLRSDHTETPEQAAPRWRAALRERGVNAADIDDVVAALSALDGGALPTLDDDVTSEQGTLFQKLVASRTTVDLALNPATVPPAALLKMRITRVGVGAAALLVAGVLAALQLVPSVEQTAHASTEYGVQFSASNIIDGDGETEWLLPDDATGWVEVRLSPPTRIETLRLRNSHNRGYYDRATHEYTVEVFVGGDTAQTIEGAWPEIEARPEWTEHAIGLDAVERIRFNVLSHHELSGGLAEMEWE